MCCYILYIELLQSCFRFLNVYNFFNLHTLVLEPTLISPCGSEVSEALLPSWKLGNWRLVWNNRTEEWVRGLLSNFTENGYCPRSWFIGRCGCKRAPGEVIEALVAVKEEVGELSTVTLSTRSNTMSADILTESNIDLNKSWTFVKLLLHMRHYYKRSFVVFKKKTVCIVY